jgi:hypothetical protein
MQLAERPIIKSAEHRFTEIDKLAFQSKNLDNASNYIIRQNFVSGWGYLNYKKMAQLMKSHLAYKVLPDKVRQQMLMILDKDWQAFFPAVNNYKIEPTNFTGCPKLPK